MRWILQQGNFETFDDAQKTRKTIDPVFRTRVFRHEGKFGIFMTFNNNGYPKYNKVVYRALRDKYVAEMIKNKENEEKKVIEKKEID